mmetsp:Transcript_2213/g.5143  ORF Transcript_2213/g.5143 Transcript_2213/m.5143 type:complete len:346 (+) Transcript_2213:22-1059(+)
MARAAVHFDESLPLDASPSQILALCRKLPHLKDAAEGQILEPKVLSGGITNVLYCVPSPLGSVVVRIFGNDTEKLIDRGNELRLITYLTQFSVGPCVYGTFNNGRFEMFFEGKTLEPADMRETSVYKMTASELARMHRVPIVSPWEKKCALWDNFDKWFSQVSTISFSDEAKQKRFADLNLRALESEIGQLKAALQGSTSPLALAHNDLLCGNILVEFENNKIHFVDFEYGMVNHVAFDIANHWNEWPGFDCQMAGDFSTFPTPEQQSDFCRAYLQTYNEAEPTPEAVQQLVTESLRFSLASNIFWALWAAIQADISEIDFDYIAYAAARQGQYYKTKASYLRLQ